MSKINWVDALRLERDVAIICQQQEKNGIYFDTDKALYLIGLLEYKKAELYKSIRSHLNYEVIRLETKDPEGNCGFVKKIYLKNGSYNAQVLKHYTDPSIVGGPFSRISIEEPDIGKRGLIINQLLNLGWKPQVFTEKGFPKLTDKGEPVDTLEEVGNFGKSLSLWYVYSHRQSQIQGFLPYVRKDHRIPASLNSCGTNTFRAVHRIVANIPRPSSVFGKEMRSLFTVPEGRVFVGADASGLELRMLAHRMNDPEYTALILHGDIHTHNQNLAGLPTRDHAKTFIYAWLYGAGATKIGSITGGGMKQGKQMIDSFMDGCPSVAKLITKVKDFASKRGYLPTVDLRKVFIRKFEGKTLVHTALNALLQSDGSIVVKRAMVIANATIFERGLDAKQIIYYHDELAFDCDPACADEVGQILTDSMKEAGEYYKLNIPITGEYKIGKDWSIH